MAAIGTETTRRLDALVVGAGFGGIYMLHKLRNDLGLDAVAIDKAGGVGGTWYWNKYPGALSDSESFVYQYSFDRDLYAQTPWKTKFVAPARDPRVPQRRRRPLRPARAHRPGDRDDRRLVRRGRRHLDRAHRPRRHLRMPLPRQRSRTAVGHQRARLPRHERLRGASRAHRRVARGPGSDRQARRRDRQRLDRQPGHHRHRADRRAT